MPDSFLIDGLSVTTEAWKQPLPRHPAHFTDGIPLFLGRWHQYPTHLRNSREPKIPVDCGVDRQTEMRNSLNCSQDCDVSLRTLFSNGSALGIVDEAGQPRRGPGHQGRIKLSKRRLDPTRATKGVGHALFAQRSQFIAL